jgi:ribosomal protein S18 acetylase RimI-like enzyme
MNIEFATKNDIKAVFALLSRCKDNLIEQGIFQWGTDYPKLESVENDIENSSLVKLTHSDQLVGVIAFDDVQEPEYKTVNWQINCESIAVIHRLAVDPQFQGKGFAKKIMSYAEKTISESGFQAIRLDAYNGNEMLIGFYNKLGYKSVGEISFPSRNLPFICMEKSLKI